MQQDITPNRAHHIQVSLFAQSDNKQDGVMVNPSKTGGSKNPNAYAEPLTTQGYEPKCTKPQRTEESRTIKGYKPECAQAGPQTRVSTKRQRFDKPL